MRSKTYSVHPVRPNLLSDFVLRPDVLTFILWQLFYRLVISLCEWSVYNENTTRPGNIGHIKDQQNCNSHKIKQY